MFKKFIKPIQILFALFIIILLFACNGKKESGVLFVKETPVKEDATKAYLHQVTNYKKDKNYLSVFYKYYNQKIALQNYLSAAEILGIATVYLADSYDYNETFLATVNEFDTKYRKEVPALKTTFVDAYLAHYSEDKSNLKKATEYYKNITLLEPNDYNSCYNTARAY